MVVIGQLYQAYVRNLQRTIQANTGKMNTIAQEVLSNMRTVKAFATEEQELSRFYISNDEVFKAGAVKAFATGGLMWFTMLVLYGTMILSVWMAGELYANGDISVGEISTFVFYVFQLNFNFFLLTMVFQNLGSLFGAADRLHELMTESTAIPDQGGDKI